MVFQHRSIYCLKNCELQFIQLINRSIDDLSLMSFLCYFIKCGVNCFKLFSLRSVQGQVVKYTLLSREMHFRLTCIKDSVDVTTRLPLF